MAETQQLTTASWKDTRTPQKEYDTRLLEDTNGRVHELLQALLYDDEAHALQAYGNVVSIKRLGYNDHGPVHARIVTYHALQIMRLLRNNDFQPSLEYEGVGTYEDAQVAVALAAFLHDTGMSVRRENHEWHSLQLSDGIIKRHLERIYGPGNPLRHAIRSTVHEAIVGHMANERVHSVEAGAVLIGDGTDLARGRARIPQLMDNDPAVGDMHRYSASSVKRITVEAGEQKCVRLTIYMEDITGLFQVEEILMTKVKASPIMKHFEVVAHVADQEPRVYLD